MAATPRIPITNDPLTYEHPSEHPDANHVDDPMRYVPGMTKRERVATEIAAGIAACPRIVAFDDSTAWFKIPVASIATQAVLLADALIAELAKPHG